MKKFLPIFLVLSSFIILNGCLALKNYEKVDTPPPTLIAVLDGGFHTFLYKTKIDIRDKHFSGLFYFKKLEDSTFRIIFMSEIGLNFFDFEYKKDSFKINNCQEFLNKKIIINTLQNDIKLLIDTPDSHAIKKTYKNKNDQTALVKVRSGSNKYFIFYDQNKLVKRVIQKNWLKRVDLLINENDRLIPQKMEIYHKKIKLSIKFNALKIE